MRQAVTILLLSCPIPAQIAGRPSPDPEETATTETLQSPGDIGFQDHPARTTVR